jgi:hypothetical protein
MRLELDPGAPLIAYGLELKGARALEQHRSATAAAPGQERGPIRWKKEYTRRTEWFLEHNLMISDFRCVLELALRDSPDTELVTWNQGKDTWFRVTIPGSKPRRVRVAPDAYFVLRQGDRLRHFFLEADRSTEEHRRLVDKYISYWWHLQDPRFADSPEGKRRVNVIFVTIGAERMKYMSGTLQNLPKPNRASHGGKTIYRFALQSDFRLEHPTAALQLLLWPRWSPLAPRFQDTSTPIVPVMH